SGATNSPPQNRPPPESPEPVAGGERELQVVLAELAEIEGGLLEVVAEDLLQLDELRAVLLEPGCEAAGGVVGGVADEEVAEAVGVVTAELRPVGPDELLTDEGDEALVHGAAAVGE